MNEITKNIEAARDESPSSMGEILQSTVRIKRENQARIQSLKVLCRKQAIYLHQKKDLTALRRHVSAFPNGRGRTDAAVRCKKLRHLRQRW